MTNASRATTAPLSNYVNLPTDQHQQRKLTALDALRRQSVIASQRKCHKVYYKYPKRVYQSDGSSYVEGLTHCASAHSCPWCTPRKLAEKREKVLKWTEELSASGGSLAMGTLTVHTPYKAPLKASYMRLKQVKARFLRLIKPHEKRLGILQSVYVIDETFTPGRRWHPHLHVLWLVPKLIDDSALAAFMDEATTTWLRAAHDVGVGPVSVSAQAMSSRQTQKDMSDAVRYVMNHGYFPQSPPTPRPNGSYGPMSPFELLELARTTSNPKYWAAYNEFERANKGQHRVTFHPARSTPTS